MTGTTESYRYPARRGAPIVVRSAIRGLALFGYAMLVGVPVAAYVAYLAAGGPVFAAATDASHGIPWRLVLPPAILVLGLISAIRCWQLVERLVLTLDAERLRLTVRSARLGRGHVCEYAWDDTCKLDVEVQPGDGDGGPIYWVRLVRAESTERLFRCLQADAANLVRAFGEARVAADAPGGAT